MIIIERVSAVAELLKTAAVQRATVSFSEFHELFYDEVRDQDKYDTLEAAGRLLCDLDSAIYTAVLAKRVDGMPGIGFYDVFRTHRREEYREIAGGNIRITELDDVEKQEIVRIERARVYEHADESYEVTYC